MIRLPGLSLNRVGMPAVAGTWTLTGGQLTRATGAGSGTTARIVVTGAEVTPGSWRWTPAIAVLMAGAKIMPEAIRTCGLSRGRVTMLQTLELTSMATNGDHRRRAAGTAGWWCGQVTWDLPVSGVRLMRIATGVLGNGGPAALPEMASQHHQCLLSPYAYRRRLVHASPGGS
jgi:hypothetical protein